MKQPIQSNEIAKLVEGMNLQFTERHHRREEGSGLCSVFGFILVLALLLILTGCATTQKGTATSAVRRNLSTVTERNAAALESLSRADAKTIVILEWLRQHPVK